MMDDDSTDYTLTYSGETVGCMVSETPTYTFDISDLDGQDGTTPLTINTDFAGTSYKEETWPSEYKVQEMIKQYPALKIQYEKFLEVYNLVKDDYKDELPF